MPHKANPVHATLIASVARQAPALAGVLYGSLVAEDERPAGAWHAEWQPLREALRQTGMAAELAADLAEGLEPRPAVMARNLELGNGVIVSERLAGVLEPLLGRAAARTAVTAAAKLAGERDEPFGAVLGTLPEISALIDSKQLTEERLAELLDPAGYLGAAAELVDRALSRGPRVGK
jgi:3-carboxy-cis,cis-muconate cycloisomerase